MQRELAEEQQLKNSIMTKIRNNKRNSSLYSEDTSRRSTSSGIKGRDMCTTPIQMATIAYG
jgi:hypothetical protein